MDYSPQIIRLIYKTIFNKKASLDDKLEYYDLQMLLLTKDERQLLQELDRLYHI